jgi:hypothetical protein
MRLLLLLFLLLFLQSACLICGVGAESSHVVFETDSSSDSSDSGHQPQIEKEIEKDGADGAVRSLKVNGESLKLTDLGPMIINPDGSARRILNWDVLTPAEQAVTWRRIKKRNAERVQALQLERERKIASGELRIEDEEQQTQDGEPLLLPSGLEEPQALEASGLEQQEQEQEQSRRRSMY